LVYDVIIAGAGPVGLFLACELRLAKLSVLVLEQLEDPRSPLKRLPFGMRGLWGPSIETFYRRGLLEQIAAQRRAESSLPGQPRPGSMAPGSQRRGPAGHFAGIQFEYSNIDSSRWKYRLPGPADTQLGTDMEHIERVLAAHALSLGVEIQRGQGVEGFETADDEITVRAGEQELFKSRARERGTVKLIDLITALISLPVALPVMAGIAVAIKLDSPGPVLFRQRRIGRAGSFFPVLKFRTMAHRQADGTLDDVITSDGDARITRIGIRLRRSRLDELPQIFNILAGQMSWIGPRPEAEALSIYYTGEIPFYRYRHVVRPGITGWAQVNQGHVASVDEVHAKLQYDFYYVKYFSAWLDILIVFRTIRTMMTGFGSR